MIKFISYDGKYPNFCSGTLILEVDGKKRALSHALCSGGSAGVDENLNAQHFLMYVARSTVLLAPGFRIMVSKQILQLGFTTGWWMRISAERSLSHSPLFRHSRFITRFDRVGQYQKKEKKNEWLCICNR